MPGGDGTGPMGWGPLSGRGLGYCSGYRGPGFVRPFLGRRYWGYPGPYQESAADERTYLQRQAEFMRTQIRMIEERLKEIEGPDTEK